MRAESILCSGHGWGGACVGVSLCYLRGGSIGAFGWGLLRLLASDFRMGARGGR